jgi:hypothetical protein
MLIDGHFNLNISEEQIAITSDALKDDLYPSPEDLMTW